MKRQIRRGVFETNSSSTHSITMCSGEEYDKWCSGKLLFWVGKKKFGELSKGFVEKPEGAPTLVSDDDPREPINKTESASADFAEENGRKRV